MKEIIFGVINESIEAALFFIVFRSNEIFPLFFFLFGSLLWKVK